MFIWRILLTELRGNNLLGQPGEGGEKLTDFPQLAGTKSGLFIGLKVKNVQIPNFHFPLSVANIT